MISVQQIIDRYGNTEKRKKKTYNILLINNSNVLLAQNNAIKKNKMYSVSRSKK